MYVYIYSLYVCMLKWHGMVRLPLGQDMLSSGDR